LVVSVELEVRGLNEGEIDNDGFLLMKIEVSPEVFDGGEEQFKDSIDVLEVNGYSINEGQLRGGVGWSKMDLDGRGLSLK
jgi:hypothetical protein